MPRSLLVVLGWVAATAAAVAVAYAGVSTVAGGVVDPLPATLGLQDTAASTEVASASPSSSPPSEATTATADGATSGSAATAPGAAPSPSAAPEPGSSQTSARDDAPAAPTGQLRTYSLVGGTATLRYSPGSVTVVSAHPNGGFTQKVEGEGGSEVTVEFESEDHRSRVWGSWDGGPRDRVEEADRGDDEPDEHDERDDD